MSFSVSIEPDKAREQKLGEAIQFLGTNGMRTLVRWAGYERPWWRKLMGKVWLRSPVATKRAEVLVWFAGHDDIRALAAAYGLVSLGRDNLGPVMNELTSMQTNTNRPTAAGRAQMIIELSARRVRSQASN